MCQLLACLVFIKAMHDRLKAEKTRAKRSVPICRLIRTDVQNESSSQRNTPRADQTQTTRAQGAEKVSQDLQ